MDRGRTNFARAHLIDIHLSYRHSKRVIERSARVALENPVQTVSGHIKKNGQSLSSRNRRACMKRLMDVSEARQICKDRTIRQSIVSAYPSGD
ncbi:hypothetical protein EVAR_40497_1 [Eumeta japonica]|uniref:Uncharacterized protein n=1 Tax=Eumeta variegata TaxID=151549 RepID=A0A4C1XUS1_EUMVA|nr:hypothetical protein EVAR_40497_1 [Eumeta japonica]